MVTRAGNATKRAGSRRSVLLQVAALAGVAGLATLWAWVGGSQTARMLRHVFEVLDPVLVLELAAALVVVGVGSRLVRDERRWWPEERGRRWGGSVRAFVAQVPTVVLVGVVAILSGLFRVVLGAANHTPKVLGDELVYSGIAKGWAFDGKPVVRGAYDVGHSTLYPLLIAPLFRLAVDGAGALSAIRVLDALLMGLTAVPAYLLARRVAPRGWALGVAALSSFVPWTSYSAFTLTESFFYPAFVGFAAVLAWTLERPSLPRQALVVGLLAVLVGIRAQGLTIAIGLVAAIVLYGRLERQTVATLRRFLPTFVVLAAGLAVGVGAKAAGVAIPTSSYNAVFDSMSRIGGMIEWGVWNLGLFEFSLGVVALAALPVALVGMLRDAESPSARSTGVVVLTLGCSIVGSVALLSASPYGLSTLHERNLFYVAPLLLTCVAHWLWRGLERPFWLSVGSAVAAVALVVALPQHVVFDSNNVDAPTAAFFVALDDQVPGVPFRVWAILIAAVGAATFLFVKGRLFTLLAVCLAFAAVTARADYRDSLTDAQARALSWVDHTLPAETSATVVYLGVPYSDAACAAAAAAEQEDLTIWTEAFNNRVRRVVHVYQPNPRDGLASPEVTVGDGGLILSGEDPYSPPYIVIDSRQPLVGTRLARFDLPSLHSEFQNGASLTLWRVDAPLRFYPRADPLPPRGDGNDC